MKIKIVHLLIIASLLIHIIGFGALMFGPAGVGGKATATVKLNVIPVVAPPVAPPPEVPPRAGKGPAEGAENCVMQGVLGQFAKLICTSISAGEAVIVNVNDNEIGVVQILLQLKEKTFGIVLEVNKPRPEICPGGTPELANFYKCIEIKPTHIEEDKLVDAQIEFSVVKSWLEERGFISEGVNIFRLVNGVWVQLDSEIIGEDEDFVYFRAPTPGFTFFGIAAQEVEEIEAVVEIPAATWPFFVIQLSPITFFVLSLVVLVFIIIIIEMVKRVRRKTTKKQRSI